MKTILIAIALLAAASAASAQTDVPTAPTFLEQVGATVTFRAGVWSSTHELDPDGPLGAGMLWGKVSRPISEHVSLFADGWTALRGPFDRGRARGDLREAFVTVTSGPFELRAGRQIFSWGRADGINPTDNLTGQDFTLLVPDESDRRIGSTAVRVSYAFGDFYATAIWLPEFRSNKIAVPQEMGDLKASASEWRTDQYAVRLEQTGRAIDWSVSAYHGRDLSPDLGVGPSGLTVSHNTVRVIGADAAGNVGRYGLRAEAAYVVTDDRRGVDPFVKNPYLFVVAGGDRTIREHLNVNVQYLYRFVTHFATPGNPVAFQESVLTGQMRRHQHGATARVSYKWFHDTLEAEVAAVGYARPRGGLIRPKVTYALSDRVKLLVGGELYRGETGSLFRMQRSNSGGFAEVRWSF